MKNQISPLELSHFPVMMNEIIQISSPSEGGIFVDCTFGGGGYSSAILKFTKTKVIAIDRDASVKEIARRLEKKFNKRFQFSQIKFSQMDKLLRKNVDVIIFDLGLSSIQLNNLERGFSFKSEDSLDMTMGLSELSAEEAVNNLSESQLRSVLKILGEEKEATNIARNIVKTRSKKKITKVNELVKIIEKSKRKNFHSKINPCTKTFQALRIFVNKEITELIIGIVNATKFLRPGGKILVVSFHSIEDKIIKYFFSNFSKNRSKPSRYLPDEKSNSLELFEKYVNKVITPSQKELKQNNPSRSAKLRYAIRSANSFVFPESFIQRFSKYLKVESINV